MNGLMIHSILEFPFCLIKSTGSTFGYLTGERRLPGYDLGWDNKNPADIRRDFEKLAKRGVCGRSAGDEGKELGQNESNDASHLGEDIIGFCDELALDSVVPGIVLAGLVVYDSAGKDDGFVAFRLRGEDITPDLRIDRGGRSLRDGLDIDKHSRLQVAREGAVCLELSQVQFGGVTTSLQILGDLVVQLSFLILEVAGPAFDVCIDETGVIFG